MRRTALVVLFLLLAAMAATASPTSAQPAPPAAADPSDVGADFNRDGFVDLAVGVPGEDGAAGAVNVLYGAGGGLSGAGSQVFTQVGGMVETGDRFGSALAAGDFNRDGFADLAASAPFEAVGTAGGAGAVSVLYGSAGGLTTSGGRLFTQVGGSPETGDRFGSALPVTLSWKSFTAAADQAGLSRQYGGIHFKDGALEARVAGAEVGEQAMDKAVTYFSGKAILKS